MKRDHSSRPPDQPTGASITMARPVRILMAGLVTAFLFTALASAPATNAAECNPPKPIALPLPNFPSTRIEFNKYKSEVKAYQECAGERADPAVQAHYEQALEQFVALIRLWGRHR